MGNCVYTGASVYFIDYGFTVPADLYEIGDSIAIRWNAGGEHYCGPDDDDVRVTHKVAIGDGWHRDDIGVTVVTREMFRGPIERPCL